MRALLALTLALGGAAPAFAGDVAAAATSDLSVTVYRAPNRNGGSIQLNALGGFAVITETRRVTLPAGESRLRFEGVVDGILAESAIITGLPGGVIEKNRDAALLSPSALMRAALGKVIQLKRTNPVTGKTMLVPAEITAASDQGITVKTEGGIEALRCSGLPETFRYSSGAEGLSARPTLSVMTRSKRPITALVTLTYIAEGFDWAANYTAQVSPDGKTLNIGGWITLANGNSVSLEDARTQIVAGGLNRAYLRKFINNQPRVLARCWPMQRTHQVPRKPEQPYQLVRPYRPGEGFAAGAMDEIMVTAKRRENKLMNVPMAVMAPSAPPPPAPPPPEQLGDLKLYRVPQRTTIAAMQMKQTRLIEQQAVPVERIYTFTTPVMGWGYGERKVPATALLRTRNDKAHQLGLPLPAGSFVVQQDQLGRTMLVGRPDLKDTAEDEKVELLLGPAPDVTVARRTAERQVQGSKTATREEVEISNAGSGPITFELRMQRWGTQRITATNARRTDDNGIPVLTVTVPANDTLTMTFSATQE
ncbi:MAG: hypothetical protein ABL926_09435 [Novosphingobium sp.]|uniref:DUF4139 domain-containing protein n=1 Tax=Novosphingobium sp. TaxID=1874826 RepID=UPI0032B70D69